MSRMYRFNLCITLWSSKLTASWTFSPVAADVSIYGMLKVKKEY